MTEQFAKLANKKIFNQFWMKSELIETNAFFFFNLTEKEKTKKKPKLQTDGFASKELIGTLLMFAWNSDWNWINPPGWSEEVLKKFFGGKI